MKKNTVWKLLLFNICFAVLEVILFSPGLVHLTAKPVLALIVGALSVGAFVGVNYFLLTCTSDQSGKLRDAQDYRDALRHFKTRQNPFNSELDEAIHQLDQFYQKQTALKALLGESSDDGNPFLAISEDVEECLFANMKKLTNRMTILDAAEPERFPMHHAFIREVLAQNKKLLVQYDNLIIEISQIGDNAQMQDLHLEHITEALRELRSGSPEAEEGMQMQQELHG